ncbi:L-aminopeptidase/D-esterase [Rhizobiales bacterium GAS191]|nr:L-aminopeptidase/D-esterase [Rhizobiales bacterium GAS191]SED08514.1 L-aminopeptidase/D-esterase [Rhizobiales bacterium GAS188]
MRNLITDVAGISVGCAHDARLASGVTAVLFDKPAVASVSVSGGAPAGRDLECLAPDARIEEIDAILLSGGSAFGLDAASGAQAWLRERGRGHLVRSVRVPIVPQAICFDLLNGGDKDWGRYPPYREIAYAASDAAGLDVPLGSAGAGFGATTVNLKGGQGSTSARTPSGHVVAALAVVNAIGSAVIGDGPHFWAAPFEQGQEFGGLGSPARLGEQDLKLAYKGAAEFATTIALVATDAVLTKAQAKRLAVVAQGGLSKGLRLAHALSDGDMVFAAATGRNPLRDSLRELIEIGATASDCLARAVARGVYEATALPFAGALPAWRDKFGG